MGDCRGAEELLESANYDNLFNQSFQFMKTTAEVSSSSFLAPPPLSLCLSLASLSSPCPSFLPPHLRTGATATTSSHQRCTRMLCSFCGSCRQVRGEGEQREQQNGGRWDGEGEGESRGGRGGCGLTRTTG
eukprot:767740-Hanusia_phi.AAC.1